MFVLGQKYRITHRNDTVIEGIVYLEDSSTIQVEVPGYPGGIVWKKENILTWDELTATNPVLDDIMIAAREKRARIVKAKKELLEKQFELDKANLYLLLCKLSPGERKTMSLQKSGYQERLIEEFAHPNLSLTWEPMNYLLGIEFKKE